MAKGIFGRLGPALIILLVLASGITVSGGLSDAWRPILLMMLYLGYLVWREVRMVRDPDYAAHQTQKASQPGRQAQSAGMAFFVVFVALLVLLLLANMLFPQILNGVDAVKGEMVVMYAGIFGMIGFMLWRYWSPRR